MNNLEKLELAVAEWTRKHEKALEAHAEAVATFTKLGIKPEEAYKEITALEESIGYDEAQLEEAAQVYLEEIRTKLAEFD